MSGLTLNVPLMVPTRLLGNDLRHQLESVLATASLAFHGTPRPTGADFHALYPPTRSATGKPLAASRLAAMAER